MTGLAATLAAPLRIGVTAYRPPAVVEAEFRPVADALSNALARPVELRILPPLVLTDAYAEGRIDLLFGGSQLHSPLQRRLPLPAPIATLRREFRGEPLGLLAGTLLTRADSAPLSDLRQLVQYRLAVPESVAPEGGEELARQLAARGLPPIPASQLVWTSDNDSAIQLLVDGGTDLVLVRSGLLETLIGSGAIAEGRLKVVAARQSPGLPLAHSTLPVPEWSVLPSPRMDAAQRRQLAITLLEMELPVTAPAPGAQPIVGFDPPADYSQARLPATGPTPAKASAPTPIGAFLLVLLLPLTSGLAVLVHRRSRALAAAEARSRGWRQLLDGLPVGFWHRDRQGQFREINARVREVLGLDRAAQTKPADYAALFPETVATQLAEADAEALTSGSVRHRRVRLATPDGRLRELELVQVRTVDARGEPDGVSSVAIERTTEAPIDPSTLLTEYEQLLSRLSAELVSADARSVDAAIRRALAALGAACVADRAYLFLFNAEGRRADNTHEWCRPGIEPQIAQLQDVAVAQNFPWALAAFEKRQTLAVEDVDQMPAAAATEQRWLRSHGIRSVLLVPMSAGERLVGLLGLDDTHGRRHWQPGEQSLLRVVGEMLVHALLRLSAERSHDESVAYLRALLGALPDLLFVFDTDGHYLDLHARDRAKLFSSDQIGRNVRDAMPPAVAERTQAALARILGGSTLERFDYTLTIDGRELTFAAELVPLDPGRVLAVCRDISERRETEQALAASEARYRALVDHSQSLIFQVDGQHRLRFLSRSAHLLLGQLPGTLIGHPLAELVDGEDHPTLRRYLARLGERPAGSETDPTLDEGVELRFRQPDGQPRWLHVVMTPVIGAGAGADAGLVGNAVDITGRVEARQQLAALAAQLQAVIDGVPSHIFAKDADGRFVLANQACAASFGRTPVQLIGLTDAELLPEAPDLARAYREDDQRAAASDQPVLIEREQVRRANGMVGWYQTIKTRWFHAGDPRPGILGVATDISARIAAEDQLRHESELTGLLVRLALTYIDLPAEQLPDTIRQSVQELAGFVAADRGYLFRYDHADRTISNTVEWCAEGITAQIAQLQRLPIDAFAELTALHFRGEVVEIADLADLGDPATREHLSVQGIRSLLSVPLMRGSECVGFVGFDWVRAPHRCSTGEIQLLTVFAQMLVNAQVHADTAEFLEQQRRRLELIVEGTAAGTWIWWPQNGALEINERWAGILGYTTAELEPVGFQTWRRLSNPEDLDTAESALAAHAAGQSPLYEARIRMRHKDGRWVWVLTRGRIVRHDLEGRVLIYAGTHQDITAQVEAEERLRLAASVFTHSHEGILITDAESRIVDVNEAFTRITGHQRAEVLGQNPRVLKSGRHGAEFYRELWQSLESHGYWAGEIWNRRRNGEYYAEFLAISAVRDGTGKVLNYVALFSDITAQKQYQQRLERIAHYDPLTGLPNRALLADRLRQAMAQARRRRQQVAVAFIDLDGFKSINDTHGHEVGDQFLRGVGQRMQRTLREWDTVSRLGGDEFVAVMIDLPDREALKRLLQRLAEALAEPLQVGELRLPLSASIGVTFYPQADDLDAEQLLRQADQAMYQAKRAGKRQIRYFDTELDQSHRHRVDSLARIREALTQGEFLLYYQPIVDLCIGRVVGAEALLRWDHPERGLLAPSDFLPLLEGDALAPLLGDWVLSRALADQQDWQAQGLDLGVRVNIAGQHLLQPDFIPRLRQHCATPAHGLPPRLTLEVVEGSVIDDLSRATAVIRACNSLGVGVSLDDFGTGFSSLGDLKQLPLIELKIDQRFIRDLLVDPDDLAIIDGILGLSRAFALGVVAEGVETGEQAEVLLSFGCCRLQGYALARPMPIDALHRWLHDWRPDPGWQGLPLLRRGLLPLRFAEAEIRGSVGNIAACLSGERDTLPDLDPQHCRFGSWLLLLPERGVPTDWLAGLKVEHDALHAAARALVIGQLGSEARTAALEALEAAGARICQQLRAGETALDPSIDLPPLPPLTPRRDR